jgi:GNAT superfamily N-acetyltransferase
MALDQDEVVGIASVSYVETGQAARNLLTGVDPRYRGRKIAQALKLQAIHYAREQGAAAIQTQNDAENVAILAINRKLGYQPRPGRYRLVKQVIP